MFSRRLFLAATLLMLGPRTATAAAGAAATVPLPRPEPWWLERHDRKLAELAATRPRLIVIGDSIVHDFELTSTAPRYDFLAVWRHFYGDRRAVNLGFNGDSTANALWRLDHGELAGIAPEVAMVLIGTNNTIQGQSADETLAGIAAVVATLRRALPRTAILLLGILPSAVSAAKTAADRAVNAALAARYAGTSGVTVVDLGPVLMADGQLDVGLFMDPRNTPPGAALHPDALAQARLAAALEPTLARLLGEAAKSWPP